MCRNIRTLHNFDPPATSEEASDAALQYVRKISGSTKPSKANQEAFDRAVAAVTQATERLLADLVSAAPPFVAVGDDGAGGGDAYELVHEDGEPAGAGGVLLFAFLDDPDEEVWESLRALLAARQ